MKQTPKNSWRRPARSLAVLAALALAILAAGCASESPRLEGPQAYAHYSQTPWDKQRPNSKRIDTEHYQIYTDLSDDRAIERIVQVLEGANQQYRRISPEVPPTALPLKCFIFSRRDEWAEFTKKNTGADAAIYLRINRGGYAIDDWFVAFWIGDRGVCAVAAHEGWHQFVGRHYAARMPPSLEEGLGCMFETITWEGHLPRWRLESSQARSRALAEAIAAGRLWKMSELLRLHAGEVIRLPRPRVNAYYAQNWAMARFLLGENSRYRPAMRRYLADLISGNVYRPANLQHLKAKDWSPEMSVPQLEHYLGKPLEQIEGEYLAFCRAVANETRVQ